MQAVLVADPLQHTEISLHLLSVPLSILRKAASRCSFSAHYILAPVWGPMGMKWWTLSLCPLLVPSGGDRQTNRHSHLLFTNTMADTLHLLAGALDLIDWAHECCLQEVLGGEECYRQREQSLQKPESEHLLFISFIWCLLRLQSIFSTLASDQKHFSLWKLFL